MNRQKSGHKCMKSWWTHKNVLNELKSGHERTIFCWYPKSLDINTRKPDEHTKVWTWTQEGSDEVTKVWLSTRQSQDIGIFLLGWFGHTDFPTGTSAWVMSFQIVSQEIFFTNFQRTLSYSVFAFFFTKVLSMIIQIDKKLSSKLKIKVYDPCLRCGR